MEKFGGIDSLEYLESLIKSLKRVNIRMYSNMTLDDTFLEKLIAEEALQYSYMPCKYLNLWYEERDFIRIIYFIADLEFYETIDFSGKSVIEIFEAKKKAQTEALINKTIDDGYKEYSRYHRWVLDDFKSQEKYDGDYIIHEGVDERFYMKMICSFNVYEDHVPLEDNFKEYCKDKVVWSVLSADNKSLMAGLIVSIKGKIQIEEFVFVSKEYQRRGIASAIHKRWIESSRKESVSQHIAWINDTNTSSIGLHAGLGYKQQETYKIVLTKGL